MTTSRKELEGLRNIVRADLEAQEDPCTRVPPVMNDDGSIITPEQAERIAKTIDHARQTLNASLN